MLVEPVPDPLPLAVPESEESLPLAEPGPLSLAPPSLPDTALAGSSSPALLSLLLPWAFKASASRLPTGTSKSSPRCAWTSVSKWLASALCFTFAIGGCTPQEQRELGCGICQHNASSNPTQQRRCAGERTLDACTEVARRSVHAHAITSVARRIVTVLKPMLVRKQAPVWFVTSRPSHAALCSLAHYSNTSTG